MKSFYSHGHKINRKKKDKEDYSKNKEKTKSKTKRSSSFKDFKGGGENLEDITDATFH